MTTVWKGCAPGNFRSGRAGWRPQAIVIHISEGSLESADAWFSNAASKVSAHYIVGRAGEVHQYVHEEDVAFHAGNPVAPAWKLLRAGVNPNLYTVGIEHEGRSQDPWPEAQYQASAALAAAIAARWGIPLDSDHVVLHREIRASKTCPGFVFDRAKLLALAGACAPPSGGLRKVTLVTRANLRVTAPALGATIRTVLEKGTAFSPAGAMQGETVEGNAAWYRLAEGGYVWAGATDQPRPAL